MSVALGTVLSVRLKTLSDALQPATSKGSCDSERPLTLMHNAARQGLIIFEINRRKQKKCLLSRPNMQRGGQALMHEALRNAALIAALMIAFTITVSVAGERVMAVLCEVFEPASNKKLVPTPLTAFASASGQHRALNTPPRKAHPYATSSVGGDFHSLSGSSLFGIELLLSNNRIERTGAEPESLRVARTAFQT
jgi:hypothetical protein